MQHTEAVPHPTLRHASQRVDPKAPLALGSLQDPTGAPLVARLTSHSFSHPLMTTTHEELFTRINTIAFRLSNAAAYVQNDLRQLLDDGHTTPEDIGEACDAQQRMFQEVITCVDEISSECLAYHEQFTPLGFRKFFFGYYSLEAAKLSGSSIYQTPDGREVEVTYVCKDPRSDLELYKDSYKWPDTIYVGPVTHYLRKGSPGESMAGTSDS